MFLCFLFFFFPDLKVKKRNFQCGFSLLKANFVCSCCVTKCSLQVSLGQEQFLVVQLHVPVLSVQTTSYLPHSTNAASFHYSSNVTAAQGTLLGLWGWQCSAEWLHMLLFVMRCEHRKPGRERFMRKVYVYLQNIRIKQRNIQTR